MDKKKSLFEIHAAVLLFGLLFLWLSKQSMKISPRKNYLYLIFLGLILAVHWVSFFKSIQISTVAVGLLSFATYPVFTTFLEPLLLKEKIIKMNISFSLFCVIGVFLIIPRFGLDNSTFVGVLWGLLSSITFAVLTILNRKLTQHFSSLLIAFYQDFFAMLFLLPFYFVLRPALNTNDILLLCVLGVFCTAGSHTLFIKGMKRIKAQTASMIHFLEPVYGIIFAFFFLHEIPSPRIIFGGVIILSGQILIILRIFKKRKKDAHKV